MRSSYVECLVPRLAIREIYLEKKYYPVFCSLWSVSKNPFLFYAYVIKEVYICRVGVKIRVRVKGVKRIPICIRRYHYAIEEIFTSAYTIMIEFHK